MNTSHATQTGTFYPCNSYLEYAAMRRELTPAQKNVQPLLPIFEAARKRGLEINPTNRAARITAINRYLADGCLPFDWLLVTFKELMKDPVAVIVIADAIEAGVLSW